MSDEIYYIGVDTGTTETGICIVNDAYKPLFLGKIKNEDVIKSVDDFLKDKKHFTVEVALEMVASYGMPVGKEVFDTCVWIGRFWQEFINRGYKCSYIYRKDEKMAICHSMKANDATIKQALVDRFAYGISNYGKGSKKNPGWFYGFKSDIWASYAVVVTYIDMKRGLL